jgi:hypothetical protein
MSTPRLRDAADYPRLPRRPSGLNVRFLKWRWQQAPLPRRAPVPVCARSVMPSAPELQSRCQLRIPTAREATKAIVMSDMEDSAIIKSFARTVRGNVSAGARS